MVKGAHPSRREFVQRVSLAAGLAAMGPFSALVAGEKAADKAADAAQTPDDILANLISGNERFASGSTKLAPRTAADFARDATGQAPPAIILGCADSRVPPELVFDQPIGGLFVLRVAGNIVGSGPILKGSIEFAVAELGARLIMVLGHSKCGACAAAIQHIENKDVLPGSIEGLVDYIRPVVRQVRGEPGDKLENVIKQNALDNAQRLASLGPILPEFVKRGELKAVAAYYDLKTGRVEVLK